MSWLHPWSPGGLAHFRVPCDPTKTAIITCFASQIRLSYTSHQSECWTVSLPLMKSWIPVQVWNLSLMGSLFYCFGIKIGKLLLGFWTKSFSITGKTHLCKLKLLKKDYLNIVFMTISFLCMKVHWYPHRWNGLRYFENYGAKCCFKKNNLCFFYWIFLLKNCSRLWQYQSAVSHFCFASGTITQNVKF